jgi:hypothetical protein
MKTDDEIQELISYAVKVCKIRPIVTPSAIKLAFIREVQNINREV